jgi:hypothetical protein
MGAAEAEAKRITALEEELGRHVEPLFRWEAMLIN